MTDTGFVLPGAGVNNADAGNVAWSNPSRATAADGSSVSATAKSGNTTQYLQVTNFGFAVPSGMTVTGVVARVRRAAFAAGARDHTIQIIKAGTRSGNNNADTGTDWPTSALTDKDYGGASDLWGLSLTDTDTNASNFGLAVRAGGGLLSVDAVWLQIFYSTGGGGFQTAWARGSNVILGGGNP